MNELELADFADTMRVTLETSLRDMEFELTRLPSAREFDVARVTLTTSISALRLTIEELTEVSNQVDDRMQDVYATYDMGDGL